MLAGGVPWPLKFIIDGRDGTLVMPADRTFFEADELVLWVPEERFESLQLLVAPAPQGDDLDEARDRYLAYHGEARSAHWARCTVESARQVGEVWSGDSVARPNLIRAAEPRLCRTLNADRARLAELVETMCGVRPAEPLAVGVDEDGIDVRAALGIIRVELPRRARDEGDADAMIRGLLEPGLGHEPTPSPGPIPGPRTPAPGPGAPGGGGG